jgi:hypothetical protein
MVVISGNLPATNDITVEFKLAFPLSVTSTLFAAGYIAMA